MDDNKSYPIILFSTQVDGILSIGKRFPCEPKKEKIGWPIFILSPLGILVGILFLSFSVKHFTEDILIGIFMFASGGVALILSFLGLILMISTPIKNKKTRKRWEKEVKMIKQEKDNDTYRQHVMGNFLATRETPQIIDCDENEGIQKGVCEQAFYSKLRERFVSQGCSVYIDKKIMIDKPLRESDFKALFSQQKQSFFNNTSKRLEYLFSNQYYYPDFIIKIKNIFIDIEIDEPYSGSDKSPIHYIGADDLRNQYMNSCGFEIIRFSEKQIVCYPDLCLNTIEKTIECIINGNSRMCLDNNDNWKTPRWSKEESQMMSKNDYRETYL